MASSRWRVYFIFDPLNPTSVWKISTAPERQDVAAFLDDTKLLNLTWSCSSVVLTFHILLEVPADRERNSPPCEETQEKWRSLSWLVWSWVEVIRNMGCSSRDPAGPNPNERREAIPQWAHHLQGEP
ncbi:hypothetical protein ILYODFUR_030538 [Ilyodon furcidens]|uniref:Uncharacterized protein n=1 Tax=Ilyodon furcidens TaxID=33524 RepID=A0ABV0UCG7_9TELE